MNNDIDQNYVTQTSIDNTNEDEIDQEHFCIFCSIKQDKDDRLVDVLTKGNKRLIAVYRSTNEGTMHDTLEFPVSEFEFHYKSGTIIYFHLRKEYNNDMQFEKKLSSKNSSSRLQLITLNNGNEYDYGNVCTSILDKIVDKEDFEVPGYIDFRITNDLDDAFGDKFAFEGFQRSSGNDAYDNGFSYGSDGKKNCLSNEQLENIGNFVEELGTDYETFFYNSSSAYSNAEHIAFVALDLHDGNEDRQQAADFWEAILGDEAHLAYDDAFVDGFVQGALELFDRVNRMV